MQRYNYDIILSMKICGNRFLVCTIGTRSRGGVCIFARHRWFLQTIRRVRNTAPDDAQWRSWARSGTAGEAKASARRAGLAHAARIGSLRASCRCPGAGAAAGARCLPVCPRARARNEPVQNGGLVDGAPAPTSAHPAIAHHSAPLALACSVSTPGRSLSHTVRPCPRPASQLHGQQLDPPSKTR